MIVVAHRDGTRIITTSTRVITSADMVCLPRAIVGPQSVRASSSQSELRQTLLPAEPEPCESPAAAAAPSPVFPNLGVRLQVLQRLADAIPDAAFTTNQLCHEFVRQRTVPDDWTDVATLTDRARGYYAHSYRQRGTGLTQTRAPAGTRSYVQLLSADAKTRKLVGVATHFVSHAWKYTFRDVVAALTDYETRGGEQHFYWFDCVSVDQHASQSFPREWWSTTFRDAIGAMGHTVMVLAPWERPYTLTRAWCLRRAPATLGRRGGGRLGRGGQ